MKAALGGAALAASMKVLLGRAAKKILTVAALAALALTGCSSPARTFTSADIFREVMFEKVSSEYKAAGLTLDRAAYDRLDKDVCSDMRNRGPGYFTTGDVSGLGILTQRSLARTTWLVFAPSCYPNDYRLSDSDMDAVAELGASIAPEFSRRMEAAGLTAPSPRPSPAPSGAAFVGSTGSGGYTTRCADGSYSHSGGKQGACSWHGGVSK